MLNYEPFVDCYGQSPSIACVDGGEGGAYYRGKHTSVRNLGSKWRRGLIFKGGIFLGGYGVSPQKVVHILQI